MRKQFLAQHIFTLLMVFLAGTSTAQITFNDTSSSNQPSAISAKDLNVRIELTHERIKSIHRKVSDTQSVDEIKELLPEYSEFIKQQKKAYLNFKKSHPNKQKVINIINKWGSYNAYLDNWQNIINKHLDKNAIWTVELKKMEKEWELTYKSVVRLGVNNDVKAKVLETKNSISKLLTNINKQNVRFLALENKILLQKETINGVVDELEVWKKSEEFSIFSKRHHSLWNSEELQRMTREPFDAWASFKENVRGIGAYFKSPENNLLMHSIFLIIMAIWMGSLKRSYRSFSISAKDTSIISSKNVIVNHLGTSIVFTSLIWSMVYFTHTPNLLAEIMLFMALIAVKPLLTPLIHKRFNSILYFITILFILDTLKSYVWYSSVVYRWYLFFETFAVIGLILKVTYPYLKTRTIELNNLSTILLRLTPVLYISMGIAFVSNVLGYTNLTDIMLKVAIKGSALVVVLYGILIIVGGIVNATVHYYFSKLEQYDFKNRYFIEKRARQLVQIFAYVFFVVYFLHVIDLYDQTIQWITERLEEPIEIGVITFTIGSILSFFAVLFGSFAVTSFISRIIDGGLLNFLHLPKGVPAIISVVIRYSLLAFAFVIAMSSIGINLSQFNLMAGALGLGIGFGLQNIISNFISGLILIFERPIQTEDVVEVGALLGEVRKIGVRSSNIRTFDGAEVVVPNSNLISNEVINWTLSDNVKRIEIKIGAAYGTDLQKVVDILIEEAQKHPKVLKDPPPNALFDEFGDSSLNFRLLFWVPVEFGITSKSEVSIAVYNRFAAEEITIPFPQRDINFNLDDLKKIQNNGKR